MNNPEILRPDTECLVLDEKHPGINDEHYKARRQYFFDRSREYRLANKGVPSIDYLSDEHAIWQQVSRQLVDAHQQHACSVYLEGKALLDLTVNSIPDFVELDKRLQAQHGFRLIPAEGLIDTRNFFRYLSERGMPCTQFLRHGSNPEYTPEPDAVHDVIGHIPPLMNAEYVEMIQLVGQGVKLATEEQLLAWERMYWFTVEFGLIEEHGELKAFGAGLLSSYGEMTFCFSDEVTRVSFDLDKVIHQDYDPTRMQTTLFVLPSLASLHQAVAELIARQAKERESEK